jgi:hypothetical protein
MNWFGKSGFTLLFLIVLTGCSEPPVPPEVQQALDREQDLWRAGAAVYAPDSYADFVAALQRSRENFISEKARLSWFRDYQAVTADFRAVLARADRVGGEIERNKAQQSAELISTSTRIKEHLQALRDLADAVKDRRLNRPGLTRVEILLLEAGNLAAGNDPALALKRLIEAEELLDRTIDEIRPIISRYIDSTQIAHWKGLIDKVVAESRQRGGRAIVVNKLRRQLILYEKGVVEAIYPIGLGFNAIDDKLFAGDRATPEGRYQVVSKLPNSKFFKALLINYPNDEDRRRFAEAKRRKLIPANAKIGGLIEIHGGGKEAATLGCIGLNNDQMQDLYNRAAVGTPVVIVAAASNDNLVRMALGRLE